MPPSSAVFRASSSSVGYRWLDHSICLDHISIPISLSCSARVSSSWLASSSPCCSANHEVQKSVISWISWDDNQSGSSSTPVHPTYSYFSFQLFFEHSNTNIVYHTIHQHLTRVFKSQIMGFSNTIRTPVQSSLPYIPFF